MKQLIILAALSAAVLVGCSKSDDNSNPNVNPTPVVKEAVSGDVSGTWTKGNTYKITGHLQIPASQSLVIEEGVNVIFSDSTVKPEVIVRGNLYVMGTSANPVKFTVPDAWKTTANQWGNLWGGIIAAPTCAEMLIDNAILEYGGAVTTESSPSVKAGLYKAEAGNHVPAINYSNVNGKLVIVNSRLNNQNEDGFYIEGGKVIVANNKIYTQGVSGGDAINMKSGVQADVAFNLVYSPNTNALKLSNTGDRTPQAYIVAYNNTLLNAGWRRPTIKGGSIWVEVAVRAELYNNLLVNDRFGVKRDPKNPEDNRTKVSNNLYYGATQDGVTGFQPSTEILAGTNDILSKTIGDNDPKFVNYPLTTDPKNAIFNTAWDFRLQAGSPAIGKGTTSFTRLYADGISFANGTVYKSPAPSTTIGAFGTN
ncbi:right-handed parallel beta-helix repeat-containing protein [Spirosoma endbachense]|uniref:Right-handed parallel beta-helix repeat-containing protein n=1 Tax=Spirosoma endbachense TaxID=2666025 RepID=A0A6P1VZI5_9BACT|nr:right-handed parallel beta-helix repeat-containing protein [Spirosoma endbachense]QHV97728.1 right-handed parallel beta-helix repeat-containing protein [Spirosoma endbachense]